jgi:hypothetical protein
MFSYIPNQLTITKRTKERKPKKEKTKTRQSKVRYVDPFFVPFIRVYKYDGSEMFILVFDEE